MKKENSVNPIAVGIAGVVAVGVGVAAAVLLSDKKNQKKVKDVLVGAKDKVIEFAEMVQSQPAVKQGVKRIESVTKDVKNSVAGKS